jgi:hypothetical protein
MKLITDYKKRHENIKRKTHNKIYRPDATNLPFNYIDV